MPHRDERPCPYVGPGTLLAVTDGRLSKRGTAMLRAIVALMVIYLGLTTGLALQYDRQFFMTDAIAAAFFGVTLIALLVGEGHATHR
jgi:hypothetical protein